MSHFPMLVIGDDYEMQLAPFDEGIDVPEYIDSQPDDWQEALAKAREHLKPEYANLSDQEVLATWSGENVWRPREGGGYDKWITYNPQSKWDWYVPGGRWQGSLVTKHGTKVDSCKAYDLDLDLTLVDFTPHALLMDGHWYEQGRMGWFGMVADPKSDEEWGTWIRARLDALDPLATITLVDCHI